MTDRSAHKELSRAEFRPPTVSDQVNQYRTQRRRRLQATHARGRGQFPSMRDDLIHLAWIWAPYGIPPQNEVFERFGISQRCFTERVRQALQAVDPNAPMVATLAAVYANRSGRHGL
ncbi:hypothetical protein R1CP_36315 (plasmid) [Rhodococcus opacus]|uniref:Uncharacterized protein n=1 Tax=Rhodococcus opacus TaxID=37919 RepID=A0A1B1KH04_RHOOP|nr:hypothetical protein R1CP_36315 [Rhodococcus opacus]